MAENHIAFFISPHGFGHAARACAVMETLHRLDARIQFEIFTRAPRWFFDVSLQFPYRYHELITDIGMVQNTPLAEDLPATIDRLSQFMPFSVDCLESIARQLANLQCRLAVCDISPLGIAAAHAAGIPVVLIENFTWDWIYAGYLEKEPRFAPYIQAFCQLFASADVHIQTAPACNPLPSASLLTHPVARYPRHTRDEVRARLRISSNAQAVLVSMGGFELQYDFLGCLARLKDVTFIIPGGAERVDLRDNLVLLPHHSDYFHPDLVFASDAIISKAGYSTISEAYYAGIPYGYVSRTQFRESLVLSGFIQNKMIGIEIDGGSFQTGDWIEVIPALLQSPRIHRDETNGAQQIADFLLNRFLTPA
jgi:UDP:flavonoid glycosyltransferase YjiC (YdhE family)